MPHENAGFRQIQALKAQLRAQGVKVTIPDLIAMDRTTDPFLCGSPTDIAAAEWFAALWQSLPAGSPRAHIRRVHYLGFSRGAVKPDGRPYLNTDTDAGWLGTASKKARYLGLVDPLLFDDRRNTDPHLFAPEAISDATPAVELPDPRWALPGIVADLAVDLDFPDLDVLGYDYDLADQPIRLALLIEKSTMNDVLVPLCEELGVELLTGAGFDSVTRLIAMLRRANDHGAPFHVFYVSDFDYAGVRMPVAAARQIEFWMDAFAPDVEITLSHLALTREQAEGYDLPFQPGKQDDRRRANFEAVHGDEGVVELDALEAFHPGVLEAIVRDAVAAYRDDTLADRLEDTACDAESTVAAAWAEATTEQRSALAAVEVDAAPIVARYQRELEQLRDRLAAELAPLATRLESVWHATRKTAEGFEPDLPDRPEAEVDPPDGDDCLFDSARLYLDQLEAYKVFADPQRNPR